MALRESGSAKDGAYGNTKAAWGLSRHGRVFRFRTGKTEQTIALDAMITLQKNAGVDMEKQPRCSKKHRGFLGVCGFALTSKVLPFGAGVPRVWAGLDHAL